MICQITNMSDQEDENSKSVSMEAVDLEDGELSEEEVDDSQSSTTNDALNSSSQATLSGAINEQLDISHHANDGNLKQPTDAAGRRQSAGSDNSENNFKDQNLGILTAKVENSSESSSSSEEDKSEKKRKKKEEKRRKKEKRREKRKREKQKEKEAKKKRRKLHLENSDEDDLYDDYYEKGNKSREPLGMFGDKRSGMVYEKSPPPGPYDSPPPEDDSSDEEFSEALLDMVQSELMDPNVALSDKELFKKSQKWLPNLTAAKLNKIIKKKKWKEMTSAKMQQNQRRPAPRRGRDDEPRQKCKFYAEGKCQKGERCQYSHNFIPAKKMEACKFFLQGYCAKGDMCIYLHSEVPCKYFHTGQKCFNGDKCKFSHDPLTDSTRPLLEKAILLEETGTFKPDKPSLLGDAPKESQPARFEPRFNSAPTAAATPTTTTTTAAVAMAATAVSPEPAMPVKPEVPNSPMVLSIFDLHVKPTADLQEKLDAGLYDEITCSLSDAEEKEVFGSAMKPPNFYTDTLSMTPNRQNVSTHSPSDVKGQKIQSRKNRWGPDLPATKSSEESSTENHGERLEPIKKTPLLPLPTPQLLNPPLPSQPLLSQPLLNQPLLSQPLLSQPLLSQPLLSQPLLSQPLLSQPLLSQPLPSQPSMQFASLANVASTPNINSIGSPAHNSTGNEATNSDHARTRANLNIILSAIRSSAAASSNINSTPKASDPRAVADPRVAADPRIADPRIAADPRVAVDPRMRQTETATVKTLTADPRLTENKLNEVKPSVTKTPLLPDPGNATPDPTYTTSFSLKSDPRQASIADSPKHSDTFPAISIRSAPEINGKPAKPIEYRVKMLTLENRGVYLPTGAEGNAEMQKDPRIKKRIQMSKQVELNMPLTLPDITSNLQMMQNALNMNTSKGDLAKLSKQASNEPMADPRLTIPVISVPDIGQGDLKTLETPHDNNKPRNQTRTFLSKVHTGSNLESKNNDDTFSSFKDTDDDEDNNLTIDMTEDEVKNPSRNINGFEAACL